MDLIFKYSNFFEHVTTDRRVNHPFKASSFKEEMSEKLSTGIVDITVRHLLLNENKRVKVRIKIIKEQSIPVRSANNTFLLDCKKCNNWPR